MNLLQAENISKSYGTRVLFTNLTFGLDQGQKTALVARNGSGKTTLLNIIAGLDTPDSGAVVMRNGVTLGYLPQEPEFAGTLSVMDALLDEDLPVMQTVRRYEDALEAQRVDDNESTRRALQKAIDEMDQQQAWNLEAQARGILTRFGLQHWHRKVGVLSGGQKKRLALCRLLLREPDIMVLDEPTNHLDIDMIEWLEGYLSRQHISLLMVTHDRYFLDKVCNDILELDRGELFRYKGKYDYFLERKAERQSAEASSIEKARNLYSRELEWIRRQPKARGTKSKSRVDAFDDIKDKAFTRQDTSTVQLDMKMNRIGGKIMEIKNISKTLGEQCCVKNFTYTFKQQERVGIVGRNGAGKSTFLNLINGQIQPDAGQINTGESVVMGYFNQQHLILAPDKKVIDVVTDIADVIPLSKGGVITAAQLLQRFLFTPDMHHTPVNKLSGGEKRRLQLITVLMKNPNFIILDEPTNDLDLLTLGVLEDFLADYKGVLVMVSHDRYFMDRLVDHLFIFDGEGGVTDFNGNYTDYRLMLDDQKEQQLKEKQEQQAIANSAAQAEKKSQKKLSYKEKVEYEQLEQEIAGLEAEKAGLEIQMAEGSLPYDQFEAVNKRYEEVKVLIDEKSLRWLELAEKL